MSFEQLLHVSKIGQPGRGYFDLVWDWKAKRDCLAIYLRDLPTLQRECRDAHAAPYENNPRIMIIDAVPSLRLASACEAAANCLYGMAEIAAQFGNQASEGFFPASFNALRRRIDQGAYSTLSLPAALIDPQWYRKVRELRTEWTHFSTIFVGRDGPEPVIVVRCRRRPSDRQEFQDKIQIRPTELIEWIEKAITAIDSYGNHLLRDWIIPRLDLTTVIRASRLDSQGWPIITEDHRFEIEHITTAEYLARCGIRVIRTGGRG